MNIQQMTLGQKIAAGYTLLLGITIGLGLMALWNMWNGAHRANLLSSQYLPEASIAATVQEMALTANLNARSYALTGEKDYLDRFNTNLEKIQSSLRDAEQLTAQFSSPDRLRDQTAQLENKLAAYRQTMDATVANQRSRAQAWDSVNVAAANVQSSLDEWVKNQSSALREAVSSNATTKSQELLQRATLLSALSDDLHQIRLTTLKAQASRNHSALAETQRLFGAASAHLAQVEALTHETDLRQSLTLLRGQIATYRESVAGLHKCYQETEAIDQSRLSAANEFIAAAKAVMESGFQSTVITAKTSTSTLSTASGALMIGLVVSILAGAVLSFLITRGITATVRAIIQSLSTSSEQTASAAGEISQASQSLAESSSEQAASLEQTSASLEEMAGMTKLNAENAAKAKDLADETRGAADSGSTDMRAMMSAMDDIKSASDGIAKIIKTIDEIAFQTNILALNAAVEAARAGESGLGFAVVADEVRSLAQRSAQAAKETAQHIEEAISKSERGVLISSKVAQSLQQIVAKAREVDDIVAEIATASKEQSPGIDQVNIAVSQMDKVTQSNAANAEQTASASEELNAQSHELQTAVHNLLTMVGGHAAPEDAASPLSGQALTAAAQRNLFRAAERSSSAPGATAKRTTNLLQPKRTVVSARHTEPDKIIPLDRDFKNI